MSTPSPETLEDLLYDAFARGKLGPFLDIAHTRLHSRLRDLDPDPLDTALVDARLHVLVARERRGDGRAGPLIGAFAVFNATPTLLGARHAVYSADAYGFAAHHARQGLSTPVPVGIGGGALGDANLKPRGLDLDGVRATGRDLDGATAMVRRVGRALGAALHDVLDRQALAYEDDLSLSFAYEDLDPVAAGCDAHGVLGAPALGGSELAASPVGALFEEGLREKPRYTSQQAPKARLPRLEAPPNPLPLRRITLSTPSGPWWGLAASPAETSHALAARIRDAITQGAWPLTLVSPAGEFGSYVGTRWEYTCQAYEGGATLYGRYQGDVFVSRFASLPTAAPSGTAHFSGTPTTLPLRLGRKGEKKKDKPNALVADIELQGSVLQSLRKRGRPSFEAFADAGDLVLRGSFDGVRPTAPIWEGSWAGAAVIDPSRTAAAPIRFPRSGLPADDRHATVLVWADVRKRRTRWYLEVVVPGAGSAVADAALVVFPPLVGGSVPRFLDDHGLFDATWP